MTTEEAIKEECERIWTQPGVASQFKRAKWAWDSGRLVPFVGKRYQAPSYGYHLVPMKRSV